MERSSSYQTRQGALILGYLASLGDKHVTAGDVAIHFEAVKPPIGKTTVYRHLEKLVAGGKLQRYFLQGGESACYQFINGDAKCREHFHLKCEDCGELIHLDCDVLEDVAAHVRKDHNFEINPLKTVFYGVCGRCSRAKKKGRKRT